MSALLTDPTTVVLVGGSDEVRDRIQCAVLDGTTTDVCRVESVGAAVETVETRDAVGCVLVLAADDVTACCDALRESSELVPVVVHVPGVDDQALGALAEREHCRYLPRSVDDDRIRSVVDGALAAFDGRRRRDAESSLFTTLLDDGMVNLYAKDEAGRHLYKADIDETLNQEDPVGKTDLDLVPDQFADSARRTHRDDLEVVETGEPFYDRVEHYEGNDEFWVETSKIPWREGDTVCGLIGVTNDVSRREQALRELERERQRVERFVTYVSHDLRTPLQIAIGALDRARGGDEAAFDRLENAHDRIQDVVSDLGTLAQDDHLSSGAAEAETRTGIPSTKLLPLVESVWETMDTRDATLAVRIPGLTTVSAGRHVLRPLLENLLQNAIDHGGPSVTVEVGIHRGQPGFYVADDGPGIPEAEREKVTEPGYTTDDMGTGTGLSIVREIVDQQAWELTISESEAGGTRFEVGDCQVVADPSVGGTPGEAVELAESVDVGSPKLTGSSEYDAETDQWRIVGGGFNLWARTNEFHYVCSQVDGPVRIQARVADFDGAVDYSKAGVMVRDGLDEDATQAFVGATTAHGTELLWRPSCPEATRSDQLEEPDGVNWYRADFADGQAVCSVSVDGKEWQPIAQYAIETTDPVTVGLVVCSRSNEATAEATFADVDVWRLDGGE